MKFLCLLLTTILLSLPSSLLAQSSRNSMTWDAPVRDEFHQGIPEGYRMYRSNCVGPMTLVATIPVTSLLYTDLAPLPGDNCYQVTAFNSSGESLPSNRLAFQVPQPPSNLRVSP